MFIEYTAVNKSIIKLQWLYSDWWSS